MSDLMRVVTSVTESQSECTHIVEPDDLVGLRPGRDGALEVDVVALGDVVRIEAGAQLQPHHGGICNGAHESVGRLDVVVETESYSCESLTVDGELPLVFGGRPGDLGVLGAARQRLALVALRRAELQHGARQVPVRQNLRNESLLTGGGLAKLTLPTFF